MRRTDVAACAAILLLAACVGGGGATPPASNQVAQLARDAAVSLDASTMPSGDYQLDSRHTSVLWRVRHWGLAPYTGRFDTVSGQLSFNASDPSQSRVSVRIPVNSISTGLLNREGERAFDRDIAAYLGAAVNPEIVFESRAVEMLSATTGRISGDLTLNGQTHPAVIEAQFEGGRVVPTNRRPTLAFTGRAVISRSLWLAGVPALHNSAAPGDEVEIIISAEFARPA
jgi:polyisoprenoid-binding protein YceI